MARQRLPIGLQDFRTIIEEDYKYIDKTRYIHKMVTSGKYFFLSRPRRFGKSITVATLQELFLGSKELFKGLWIEDKWDWDKRHPVIRFSLRDVNFEQLGLEKAKLLEQMRVWYNGYRFHSDADRVYNPVSSNLFFEQQEFQNFWFATGTPTFLVNILKAEGLFDLHFPATSLSGFESFELDQIKPVALLFQTGYLTIQSKDEDGLVSLDYPNKEVRDSMLEVLIEHFSSESKNIQGWVAEVLA